MTLTLLGQAFEFTWWQVFGFFGTVCFFSRFLVQWIISERAGKSVVPPVFWYLSIVGSVILLIYFFFTGDPVGTLGYLPNTLIYVRNLQLNRKERSRLTETAESAANIEGIVDRDQGR